MNFFLIFTFAIVASFSLKSFDPKLLLQDPRAFVASIANADPQVVSKLKTYAQSLINDGEDTRAFVIGARDHADAAAAEAASQLDAANAHLSLSEDEKSVAEVNYATKVELEAAARVVMDDAAAHQQDSQKKYDDALETMNTELVRIAQEDSDLKGVEALLSSLLPTLIQKGLARKLLTEDEATVDPAALQKVIDLVVSLIEQGQVDKAGFIKAHDDALDVLNAAIDDHNTKKSLHTHAVGAKEVCRVLLAEATTKVKNAVKSKGAAEANKAAKDNRAADAEAHRDAEENRINAERADFEKVIELLDSL